MKVTPETITDERIRSFSDSLDVRIEDEAVLRFHCMTALMPDRAMSAAAYPLAKAAARRRVCAAINARAQKDDPK